MLPCNTQGSAETVGHKSNHIPLSEEPSFQTMAAQTWATLMQFCCEVQVNKDGTADKNSYPGKCLILNT